MRRQFTKFFPHDAPSKLFALVDDVESYPTFVPFCQSARVLSRSGELRRVENVFGVGRLRLSFVSEARAIAPRELVVESRDGALRAFRLRWLFEPEGEGCLLSCDLTLDFASGILNTLAPLAASDFERGVLAAFERRAAEKRLTREKI